MAGSHEVGQDAGGSTDHWKESVCSGVRIWLEHISGSEVKIPISRMMREAHLA